MERRCLRDEITSSLSALVTTITFCSSRAQHACVRTRTVFKRSSAARRDKRGPATPLDAAGAASLELRDPPRQQISLHAGNTVDHLHARTVVSARRLPLCRRSSDQVHNHTRVVFRHVESRDREYQDRQPTMSGSVEMWLERDHSNGSAFFARGPPALLKQCRWQY